MSRVYNFSAGPATLPLEVLETAQAELLDYKKSGMSIMECSHRGKEYDPVHAEAISNVKELLSVPDDYSILFLQGGATLQFAMAPMNLAPGRTADYTNTGEWAGKAIKEAKLFSTVHVAADTSEACPARMPDASELKLSANPAYLHITSNETIGGAQWKSFPKVGVPLVADMSSDILSRRVDVRPFGLIYAGAQKNLGPSGVTLAVIRNELAAASPKNLASMLSYNVQMTNNSLLNTPPCFAIYIVMLVTRWIKKQGLAALEARNAAKAAKLYSAIDATGFYRGTAAPDSRSLMNVTFRLKDETLEEEFISKASAAGFKGLKGHRSVGGVRASIYNAFPEEGIDEFVKFMKDFEAAKG